MSLETAFSDPTALLCWRHPDLDSELEARRQARQILPTPYRVAADDSAAMSWPAPSSELSEVVSGLSRQPVRVPVDTFDWIGSVTGMATDALALAALEAIYGLVPTLQSRQPYLLLDGEPGAAVVTLQNLGLLGYGVGTGWEAASLDLDLERFRVYSLAKDLIEAADEVQTWLSSDDVPDAGLVVALGKASQMNPDRLRVQCRLGLHALMPAGNMVVRLYDLEGLETAQILYLMSQAFDELLLFRPLCSPLNSSEHYLLCRGRKDNLARVAVADALRQTQYPDTVSRAFWEWLQDFRTKVAQGWLRTLRLERGLEKPLLIDQPSSYDSYRLCGLWRLRQSRASDTVKVGASDLGARLLKAGWNTAQPSRLVLGRSDQVEELLQWFQEHRLEFPFWRRFRSADEAARCWAALQVQDNAPVEDGSLSLTLGSEPSRRWRVLPDLQTDWLVDYHTEEARLKAANNHGLVSPLELWSCYGGYLRQALEWLQAKEIDLELSTLRQALAQTGAAVECLPGSASALRTVLRLVGLQPGMKVFDACAGWGERLLAVRSLGASYVGYDPNKWLQPQLRKMAELYGGRLLDSANEELETQELVLFSAPGPCRYSDHLEQASLRSDYRRDFLLPTLGRCWQVLAVSGLLLVLGRDLEPADLEALPGAQDCGGLVVEGIIGQVRVWRKTVPTTFPAPTLPAPSWGRRFPYLYPVLPPAQVMYERLRSLPLLGADKKQRLSYPVDHKAMDWLSCHFTERQRMRCHRLGAASPHSYWRGLPESVQMRLLSEGLQSANFYLQAQCFVCNVFSPSLCYQIIRDTVGKGAKILDPTVGWGDQLLAAMAAEAAAYRGLTDDPAIAQAAQEMVRLLGADQQDRFAVREGTFSTSSPGVGLFDLALTSPAGYTPSAGLGYNQWLQTHYVPYLQKLYQAVRPGGWVVLYVENFSYAGQHVAFRADTVEIMSRLGALRQRDYLLETISTQTGFALKERRALAWRIPGAQTVDSASSSGSEPGRSSPYPLASVLEPRLQLLQSWETRTDRELAAVLARATRETQSALNRLSVGDLSTPLREPLELLYYRGPGSGTLRLWDGAKETSPLELEPGDLVLVYWQAYQKLTLETGDSSGLVRFYFEPPATTVLKGAELAAPNPSASQLFSRLRAEELPSVELTNVSLRNPTLAAEADQIAKRILSLPGLSQSSKIVDATAGVGFVSAGLFRQGFQQVVALEADPVASAALRHNLNLYKATYKVLSEPFVAFSRRLPAVDVIVLDPNRGGPETKALRKRQLFLEGVNVLELAAALLSSGKARLVLIKVPLNFDFTFPAELSQFNEVSFDVKSSSGRVVYRMLGFMVQ